jgi:hypothetical protein
MAEAGLIEQLEAELGRIGMMLRGGFTASRAEDALPELGPGRPARTLLLVGNVGPAMYRHFFAAEGAPANALDTWTRDRIGPIAAGFGARAVFPFDGPPHHPFQRWAKRAEGLKSSPLGILIHPEFGLWHAYRAALLFDQALDLPQGPRHLHPCDDCVERPCLSTCPVTAVTPAGYDSVRCATHAASDAGEECRDRGCIARRACPVGREHAYPARAMQFHMAAFLKGHAPRN